MALNKANLYNEYHSLAKDIKLNEQKLYYDKKTHIDYQNALEYDKYELTQLVPSKPLSDEVLKKSNKIITEITAITKEIHKLEDTKATLENDNIKLKTELKLFTTWKKITMNNPTSEEKDKRIIKARTEDNVLFTKESIDFVESGWSSLDTKITRTEEKIRNNTVKISKIEGDLSKYANNLLIYEDNEDIQEFMKFTKNKAKIEDTTKKIQELEEDIPHLEKQNKLLSDKIDEGNARLREIKQVFRENNWRLDGGGKRRTMRRRRNKKPSKTPAGKSRKSLAKSHRRKK